METENRPVKEDRRIVRTKKAIKNAITQILTHKEINKITITEVAIAADVNRKTFYNYYPDVSSVLDEIENDVISSFDNALATITADDILTNPEIVFKKLNEIISTDPSFFAYLLNTSKFSSLSAKIGYTLHTKIKETFALVPLNNGQTDLMIDFISYGVTAAFKNWFTNNHGYTLSSLCQDLSILSFQGIQGFFRAHNIEHQS